MKVLFDQGTPAPLRRFLPGHAISTAYELGWHELRNGDLLRRAEDQQFAALVTTDQNLRYQQDLKARPCIVILMTTSWPLIRRHAHLVAAALDRLADETYIEIDFP